MHATFSVSCHPMATSKPGTASKASRFTNEVTKLLYNALRRRVTGNPETDCKFNEEDRLELVETAGLTRDQINKFAQNFRERNKDLAERSSTIDGEDPETVHPHIKGDTVCIVHSLADAYDLA